jgi:hypothetical protein
MISMNWNKIYRIFLVVGLVAIWALMLIAKYEEYDVNYGLAINAFLISLAITLIIIILWFRRKLIIKRSSVLTMIFLITSSPLSLFVFIELYGKFIGQYFKL